MEHIGNVFNKIYINDKFIEENDEGNIEYKLRLDMKNETSLKKLKSQITWRMTEGCEETGIENSYYLLGVYDDGTLGNLSEEELDKSINLFKKALDDLKIEIIDTLKKQINKSYIYMAHIVKFNKNKSIKEKNIIIVGDPQSGKTTLISNICYDTDIKNNILKHSHEKITGITSSIKKEIIGIKNNKIINYVDYDGWEDIYNNSDELINLFDIPVINMKNTISYMLSINTHYFIIVSKTENLSKEVKFYKEYCEYYNIHYRLFYSNELIIYNKNLFLNLFLNLFICPITDSIKINSLFRILESYDIPERNNIVSGLQLNSKCNVGDELYIINNTEISKIIVKSIHKKNINFKSIDMNESGCICFDFIQNRIKINKNTYITDKINESIKVLKLTDSFDLAGKYQCRIYNGNNYYKQTILIQNDIIELEKEIVLTDKKLIIEINNNFYLTYILNYI